MGISALEYHDRTNHSPEQIRNSTRQLDFSDQPIPFKIYEDLSAVPLAGMIRPPQIPTLRAIAKTSSMETRQSIDLDILTQLCYYSAGITKSITTGTRDRLFRAAACTGALYHIELYVVCGDMDGLDAGVYHFDPRTLRLDELRRGDYRGVLVEAAGRDDAVRSAPVTFVLTSMWWRNAWKYQARTYRHAFWDSGTILANLLGIGSALEVPMKVVTGFDDPRVARLIGVSPDREGPLELVPIGTGTPAPNPVEIDPLSPRTRPVSDEELEYELIREAYQRSMLQGTDSVRKWRAKWPSGAIGNRSSGDGDRTPLSPVEDSGASKTPLHWTIHRRGSCREYTRSTLSFRRISTILDRAIRGIPFDQPNVASLMVNSRYLIVHDIESIQPGVYQYHPDSKDLEFLRSGEFRREAGFLALDQRLAADAGLCIFFLSDLNASIDQFGNRGYRIAQLEAAVTAGRLYLGTYAHRDLGATGLTFYDDTVTDFFEPRAAGQLPMFLWTIGHPA